jgi:hypothetical protein
MLTDELDSGDDVNDDEGDNAQDLEELRRNGSIDRVRALIDSQVDVRIKRSSGKMIDGKIKQITANGDLVEVVFFDEERERLGSKIVNTKEFLRWQNNE